MKTRIFGVLVAVASVVGVAQVGAPTAQACGGYGSIDWDLRSLNLTAQQFWMEREGAELPGALDAHRAGDAGIVALGVGDGKAVIVHLERVDGQWQARWRTREFAEGRVWAVMNRQRARLDRIASAAFARR